MVIGCRYERDAGLACMWTSAQLRGCVNTTSHRKMTIRTAVLQMIEEEMSMKSLWKRGVRMSVSMNENRIHTDSADVSGVK